MKKEQTAFKHPNCGGVIMQISGEEAILFECDTCGEQAAEIDHLILRGLVIIRHGASNTARKSRQSGDSLTADSP